MDSSAGTKDNRFAIQNDAYSFPYHYLTEVLPDGQIRISRSLRWGLRYMTYLTYISDLIEKAAPKTICDVGCGDGRLLSMLDMEVCKVGVDLSSAAISFARSFVPDAKLYNCPVSEVPGTYDVVTCIETLEHVPDGQIHAFIRSLQDKVSRNGVLIISVPSMNRQLHPKHYRHYSLDLLREQLSPYFKIKETQWLFKMGRFSRILNYLLSNRFFILQHSPMLRLIWKFHLKYTYFASSSSGIHLVVVALPRKNT